MSMSIDVSKSVSICKEGAQEENIDPSQNHQKTLRDIMGYEWKGSVLQGFKANDEILIATSILTTTLYK